MSQRGITFLQQALKASTELHLDSEVLAEIASAEVAGEEVDQRYFTQLQHIEACVACAQAYADLVELMLAATADMAESAEAAKSTTGLVPSLLEQVNALWGRVVNATTEIQEAWYVLRLSFAAPTQVPTLASSTTGEEWLLFSQRVGQPVPLTIETRAMRQSDLNCQLLVRVDRLGLAQVAGRSVHIVAQDLDQTMATDEAGVARFENVPIAVLVQIIIQVQA